MVAQAVAHKGFFAVHDNDNCSREIELSLFMYHNMHFLVLLVVTGNRCTICLDWSGLVIVALDGRDGN